MNSDALFITAVYFWTFTRVLGFAFTIWLWATERRRFYLAFAASWGSMAISGFIKLCMPGPSALVQTINALVFLPVSGITGLIGLVLLSKHVKSRLIILRTRQDGSIVGVAHFADIETEKETDRVTPINAP